MTEKVSEVSWKWIYREVGRDVEEHKETFGNCLSVLCGDGFI